MTWRARPPLNRPIPRCATGTGGTDAAKGVNPNRKPAESNGNLPLYFAKYTMDSIDEFSDNGVKGAQRITTRTSPGRDCHGQQVTPDHQPATAHKLKLIFNQRKGQPIKIGTWNVRTLYQTGKLHNVVKEMKRLKVNIMGIAETRWTGSGRITTDGNTLIYSGAEEHERGVAILLDKQTSRSLENFWGVSDRIIVAKIKAQPFNVNIIQVYAPTTDHAEEEIDKFYSDLEEAKKVCKSQEVTIIMGDLNAKVGKGRYGRAVGPYGLGERNERGDRWANWCEGQDLIITNTWFTNHPRRLWTWRSPGNRVKNQIDYITINSRFRNSIIQAKSYPGADCDSDHTLLIAEMGIRLKRLKNSERVVRYDWKAIEEDHRIMEEYQSLLQNRFSVLNKDQDLISKWEEFKEALTRTAKELVPQETCKKRQQWMRPEILELMEERRKVKDKDADNYNILNRDIKKRCRAAKEEWLNQKCQEVEENAGKTNIHERIREVIGKKRGKAHSTQGIKSNDGHLLLEETAIQRRWEEYIETLYTDTRGNKPLIEGSDGPPILEEEVKRALNRMKRNKAAGPDNVTAEMLLLAGDIGIRKLTELANEFYNNGFLPDELCRSTFIAIPKKSNSVDCKDYRTISLISHVTKIILKVLLMRAREKIKARISEEQFGFKEDSGCRNAIFVLRMLSERCIQMQRDLYVCFIDYEKAFDSVKHEDLMKCLDRTGLDGKDRRIIADLYWKQEATVRLNGRTGKWIKIRKGARQGCGLSPDLFNLYTEEVFDFINELEGVGIGGRNINNLRFADDTALIALAEAKLQELVDTLTKASEEKGLKINIKKTFTMVITKNKDIPTCRIRINGEEIQQVAHFKYLGSLLTSDGRSEKDINARIGMAKSAFMEMHKLLTNKHISIPTKLRTLKCYIWPILLYGAETWSISEVMKKKLEATEMWFYRRSLKVSWTDKKSNTEILRMMGTERNLLATIAKRQMSFFGHIMRKEGLENLAVTGRVEGKRSRGRQRTTYVDRLRERLTNESNVDLLRATRDKTLWKSMVAYAEMHGT